MPINRVQYFSDRLCCIPLKITREGVAKNKYCWYIEMKSNNKQIAPGRQQAGINYSDLKVSFPG